MQGSIWKNIALLATSMVVSAAMGEVVVRLFLTVRSVGPSFSVEDPYYGRQLKRDFTGVKVTPDFRMKLTTNSLGFRGPEPRSTSTSILFIGDSFTLGYGVNDGEEFPELARKRLHEILGAKTPDVINAGVVGSGAGYWLRFLSREAERFSAKVAVFQFCSNDSLDDLYSGYYFVDERGVLVERDTVPSPYSSWKQIQELVELVPGFSHSHLLSYFREVFEVSVIAQRNNPVENVALLPDGLTPTLVRKTIDLCESKKIRTFVISVPFNGGEVGAIGTILVNHKVQFLKVPSIAQRPDLYYANDGHLNSRGHDYIANWIVPLLLADSVLAGSP